ncbi:MULTISPECIES: chromate transporter [Aerococcus]|uniref:chromate transporter n=1 Tax=Aerococcus TaxID=1375 RepID=UPI000200F879|nr:MULTISPECIES: chromate transporter [Aerococcus]AEA01772.1 chromate transport protein [Aerococcus sp. Group 1]KAA9231655.1 chromate transporter [Aerococcus mictus]MCY3031023.1 chromate transporter [Aerococcus sp. Group 1]MCY3055805.1 chromate transporter [Aerococcus sp. Group 1]MCY3057536.1 chromate transporter [Aerococcus sp. Group 1]
MIYLQLLISFLKVGAFSFGGGYAALPLIQEEIVENYAWLSMQEFTDLITISQMTPGPIAINSATFVGTKLAGPLGAIVATLGSVLPSIIIVSIIARLYFKYRNLSLLQNVLVALRPAVVAMIAAAGLLIMISAFWGEAPIQLATINLVAVAIFGLALGILIRYKVNPIIIIILAGICNVIYQAVMTVV